MVGVIGTIMEGTIGIIRASLQRKKIFGRSKRDLGRDAGQSNGAAKVPGRFVSVSRGLPVRPSDQSRSGGAVARWWATRAGDALRGTRAGDWCEDTRLSAF